MRDFGTEERSTSYRSGPPYIHLRMRDTRPEEPDFAAEASAEGYQRGIASVNERFEQLGESADSLLLALDEQRPAGAGNARDIRGTGRTLENEQPPLTGFRSV